MISISKSQKDKSAMMNLTPTLHDPELGACAFTVERLTYARDRGTVTPVSRLFSAIGCVPPATPEMLEALSEEDRRETCIAVYTDFSLSLGVGRGRTFTAPDRIHWGGETWRLVRLRSWPAFGYYQGIAVLLREEASEAG